MHKKIIVTIVLLILVFIIGYIFITDVDELTKEKKELKRVHTVNPTVEEIKSMITINGRVRKQYEILDASVMQGKVRTVFVQVGDVVKIGDPLLKLSTLGEEDTINYQISQLETAISEVEITYNQILQDKIKIEKLYQQAVVAKQEVININNELVQYLDKLEQLKKQKRKLIKGKSNIEEMSLLKSSVNGIIKGLTIEPQSYTTNSDYLRIEKQGKTEVLFYVTEKYLSQVKVGKEVEVIIDDKSLHGRVHKINIIDESGLFYPVVVKLNTTMILNHGMAAIINIPVYQNSNALVVEDRSIISYNNETYVFVVEDERVIKKLVVTAENKGDKTEILRGIDLNDSVIIRGQFSVSHGETIQSIPNQ